jgi:hypothetical protein
MAVRHALENVSEVGERLDVIELGGGNESADGGPACAATVGACEQVVLAPERDGPDRIEPCLGVKVNSKWPAGWVASQALVSLEICAE